MKQINRLKSHLVSLYTQATEPLKRENLAHLIYCLDELILDNNRISLEEIVDTFEAYSSYILEVRASYFILKGLLRKTSTLDNN